MFKYILSIPLILTLSCGRDDLIKAQDIRCGERCYTGPANTENVGICQDGTWQCDQSGNVTTCSGETLPQEEDCSGSDKNCDGLVNNIKHTPCYDGPAYTEGVGACHGGLFECIGTLKVCGGQVMPTTEKCNGLDMDCDGIINDIQPLPCYDGPPNTVTLPGCHYGYQVCNGSSILCKNEKYPTGVGGYDVVFIISTDGSMQPIWNNILPQLVYWCENNPQSYCALLTAPDSDIDNSPNNPLSNYQITVISDLSNAAIFYNNVNNKVTFQSTYWSGDVGIYDGIYDACDVSNSDSQTPFKLNWHSGSTPAVIYFTDEEGQSVTHNPLINQSNVAMMCTNVLTGGFLGYSKEATYLEYSGISSTNLFDLSLGTYSSILDKLLLPGGGSCQ